MEDESATGRVALVTGAGSGIGRCMCLDLARRGVAGIALVDRSADGIAAVAKEVEALGARASRHALDVTDDAALTAAFADARATHERLDYVMNNAAIMSGLPPFPAQSIDKMDEVLAINLRAVFVGTKLAHEALVENGGGSILCTASGAGKTPFPPDPVYGATKAAVVSLVRSSAGAFAKNGIRLNALCPSIVDTPMLAQNGNGVVPAALEGVQLLDPARVAQVGMDLLLDPERSGETPSVLK